VARLLGEVERIVVSLCQNIEVTLRDERAAAAKEAAAPKSKFVDILLEAFDMQEAFAVIQTLSSTGEEKKTYSVEKIEIGLDVSPTMAQKIRRALNTMTRSEAEELAKRKRVKKQ